MKRTVLALVLVTGVAAAGEPKVVTFGKDDLGKVPTGWKAAQTGTGEGNVWKVVEDGTAPSKSGFALAQTAESPGPMFNLCVAEATSFKDVEVTVAFKANAGKKDQGGGVVWRYVDANNYYVARYNPLENNYRVYKVVEGKRVQLGTKEELEAPAGEWHTLGVAMKGDAITCSLNGKKHLEAKDDTFPKAGKVGLWTKADAKTSFDNFKVKDVK
jgi:hypothetical protein